MSLVSCKSGEYKFIWAYLGLALDTLLLTINFNIYLCLMFLFSFRIFENDMILFCLGLG